MGAVAIGSKLSLSGYRVRHNARAHEVITLENLYISPDNGLTLANKSEDGNHPLKRMGGDGPCTTTGASNFLNERKREVKVKYPRVFGYKLKGAVLEDITILLRYIVFFR